MIINSQFLKFNKKGFSLVETIIAVAVFLIISMGVYKGYVVVLQGVQISKTKQAALNVASEQIEIIHNLPYVDVGIVDGLPDGVIPHIQNINSSGINFIVTTTIRNIDDPFDGVIGGTPNDTSPADNKLVEIEVECEGCNVDPIKLVTRISPQGLENTGDNGALFVQVLDANGLPIEGADIHIENNQLENILSIDDVTDVNGFLQIVDAPTGTEAYEITVTKNGFSTEQTYTSGSLVNPIPDKPHANVVTGQVTQITFSIDELSDLLISTRRDTCSPVGYVDFDLIGSKTIGYGVKKYDKSHTTNSSGNLSLYGMEWDNYVFNLIDATYSLAGSNPIVLFDLPPASNQSVDLIVSEKDPKMLLIRVKDGVTDLPLSGAKVTLEKGADKEVLYTGRGFLNQTDWSGGAGQDDFSNSTRYLSQDGNIETLNPAGDIQLVNLGGTYINSGELVSSTFDTGTTTNFQTLNWVPADPPIESGENPLKFQVATNLENSATSTWSFVGPDGTSGSYFTSSGDSFSSVHNGDRYIRYKAYFSTESSSYTPVLSDLFFTFSSDCTPSGQVFFKGLQTGTYTITVEKSGYTTFTQGNISVTSDWQDFDITLNP